MRRIAIYRPKSVLVFGASLENSIPRNTDADLRSPNRASARSSIAPSLETRSPIPGSDRKFSGANQIFLDLNFWHLQILLDKYLICRSLRLAPVKHIQILKLTRTTALPGAILLTLRGHPRKPSPLSQKPQPHPRTSSSKACLSQFHTNPAKPINQICPLVGPMNKQNITNSKRATTPITTAFRRVMTKPDHNLFRGLRYERTLSTRSSIEALRPRTPQSSNPGPISQLTN